MKNANIYIERNDDYVSIASGNERENYLLRKRLILNHVIKKGIYNYKIIRAMLEIPYDFLTDQSHYPSSFLYTTAKMIDATSCNTSGIVLVVSTSIGPGSGYLSALLSRIFYKVYVIERCPLMAEQNQTFVQNLELNNLEIVVGDGTLGWFQKAPFDAIIVFAGVPAVPPNLLQQLRNGGSLVIPVGDTSSQQIIRINKVESHHYLRQTIENVHFPPFIGKNGWGLDA